jgi:hypothetical protein
LPFPLQSSLNMSYPFFIRELERRCYWCSEDDKKKLTLDHLPPQSIFPKKTRNGLQLITAPICDRCKSEHHKNTDDDIFLRNMEFWSAMKSGNGKINEEIRNLAKRIPATKEQGIVLAESLKVKLPDEKLVEHFILRGSKEAIMRVLESIARGYYYRMRGEVIPENISPDFEFEAKGIFNLPHQDNPLNGMTPCVVKKDIFEFYPIIDNGEDDHRYLLWAFKFYNLDPLPIYYYYELSSNQRAI